MAMRIWHQSFTVLGQLPAYAARLQEHFRKVARPDTEVMMHGMHAGTYRTNYPGTDIKHNYMQYLHGQQFVLGGIAAEEAGFDAYAIMSIPEPALRETRSIIDIPVVGYGESAMLVARMLGERMGALIFIEGMAPVIEENAARIGLASKFGGARFVGFTFDDVLKAYEEPESLIERFHEAARAMIKEGVDVIIPGEAPLCALLMKHGVTRIDEVPIVDALGATVKMAESMVDLKRSSGLAPARRGYYTDKPPRERVKELIELYGMNHLIPAAK
jgi:Asp/Glu/hydantoin racemase